MGLRLPFWQSLVFVSCGLLFVGLLGLDVSLLLMWVQFLVCWMVLLVVTLLFVLCGFVFVRCVGTWLFDLRRFLGCIDCSMLLRGPLVMGLRICFLRVLLRLVSLGVLVILGGIGLVYLYLVWLMVQFSIFRSAILDAWRHKVSVDLCARKGFRGGPFLDVSGTLQLLNSDHVRERDKALLRGVLVGGVWNGFLLGKVRNSHVPCRFCGGMIMMGIYFGNALFHLWLRYVKILNFTTSWRWISHLGLGACFGMGGCLCLLVPIWVLLGLGIFLTVLVIYWSVLWVPTPLLLCLIGSYLLVLMLRLLPFRLLGNLMFGLMGVGVEDRLSTVSSSGAGFSTGHPSRFWAGCSWGQVDDGDQGNQSVACCRGYCSVPGPCSLFKELSCGGYSCLAGLSWCAFRC